LTWGQVVRIRPIDTAWPEKIMKEKSCKLQASRHSAVLGGVRTELQAPSIDT